MSTSTYFDLCVYLYIFYLFIFRSLWRSLCLCSVDCVVVELMIFYRCVVITLVCLLCGLLACVMLSEVDLRLVLLVHKSRVCTGVVLNSFVLVVFVIWSVLSLLSFFCSSSVSFISLVILLSLSVSLY